MVTKELLQKCRNNYSVLTHVAIAFATCTKMVERTLDPLAQAFVGSSPTPGTILFESDGSLCGRRLFFCVCETGEVFGIECGCYFFVVNDD